MSWLQLVTQAMERRVVLVQCKLFWIPKLSDWSLLTKLCYRHCSLHNRLSGILGCCSAVIIDDDERTATADLGAPRRVSVNCALWVTGIQLTFTCSPRSVLWLPQINGNTTILKTHQRCSKLTSVNHCELTHPEPLSAKCAPGGDDDQTP